MLPLLPNVVTLSATKGLSVQELRTRILAFIAYYNHTSNGAFHRTYKGPMLAPKCFQGKLAGY